MPNLYKQFRDLIPEPPLLVGTVTSLQTGYAVITLPDGSEVNARGSAVIGNKVFVRDGVIEGTAPNLSVVVIEI
jgi:hypothetical protein